MRWYLLLVCSAVLLMPARASGANYTWTGLTLHDSDPYNNSNAWDTELNWSPVGIPGVGDDVVKANEDNIVSDAARQVRSLQFSGGTLSVSTLTTTIGGSWSGGTINGRWVVPSGASLTAGGSADKWLADGASIGNSGTVVWNGGGPIRASGYGGVSTIDNENGGVFNFAADGTPFGRNYNNYYPVFNNKTGATVVKSAGGGATSCTIWTFNNAGHLQPQVGTLEFSNNQLNLTDGAAASGPGTLHLATTANLSGTFTSSTRVLFDAGSLNGASGVYAGTGILEWQGGTLVGSFTVQTGARLNVSDPGATAIVKAMADSAVLTNKGTIAWSGAGPIRADSYADKSTINNESGGVFQLTNDGLPFTKNYNNYTPLFNNKTGALFAKTGGTAVATVKSFALVNQGTLRCDSGIIDYDGSVYLNDGGTITGSAAHQWGGETLGTVTLTGTTTVAGRVNWVGGNVVGADDGSGALATSGTGLFDWQSGALSNSLTFNANGNFLLSGAGLKHFTDGAMLTNKGKVTWSGTGVIRAQCYSNTSTINNEAGATWSITGDAAMTRNYSNYLAVFNNHSGATLQKSAGADVTDLAAWNFNNSGLAQATQGTLRFSAGGSSSGRFDAASGAALQFSGGTQTLQNGVQFTGTGKVQVSGGTVNATGTQTCSTTGMGAFEVNSGVLNGIGTSGATLAGSGALKWTGGVFAGLLKIASGSSLTISGSGLKETADGMVLQNSGNILWLDGLVRANAYSSTSTIDNLSGGVFTFGADGAPFGRHYASYVPVFNNNVGAKLVKSAGSGTTSCGTWTFNNGGAIQVNSGTLEFLNNSVNIAGGSTASGTGTLHLSATVGLTGTMTSTARVLLDGGSLTGAAGVYSGTGVFDWQGGTLVGDLTLASGAKINVSGSAVKALADYAVLNNKGTITWSGTGPIRAQAYGATSTINNESGGVFALASDGTPLTRNYASYTPVFNNKAGAVLRKSGGTGATQFGVFTLNNGGITETTLTAGGEIQSSVGTLEFYNQSNLYGAKFSGAGQSAWHGAVALYGTTTISSTRLTLVEGSLTGVAAVGTDALPAPTISTMGTGLLVWSGGGLYGTFNLGSASTCDLSGNTIKGLGDGAVFNNRGTVNLLEGTLRASAYSATSTFNNLSGATFNATGGTAINRNYANYQATFNNSGLLNLAAGADPVTMGWNFSQASAGVLQTNVSNATNYGRMSAGGSVALAGALKGLIASGYVPSAGTAFNLITPGTAVGGTFTGLPQNANFMLGGRGFNINYLGGDGNDVVLTALRSLVIKDAPAKLEGNSGSVNAIFAVVLSEAATEPVSVHYATANGSTKPATGGTDYVVTSGTLTFDPGQTSKNITVAIKGDYDIESDETFFVNLSAPVNAIITDPQGLGTITDDDTPTLLIEVNPATITEGGPAAIATVKRNAGLETALTVDLSTSVAGQLTIPATVTIPQGASSVTCLVKAENDTFVDGNVAITLTATASGYVSGSKVVTVNDNDVPTLQLSASANAVAEGGSGITGTVTRNTPTTTQLVVTLSTSIVGQLTVPVGVTIPAGSATANFPITAVNDIQVDGSPVVTITANANGFTKGTITVTATDNDVPTLTLTSSAISVAEGGTAITGTVSRNTPTATALIVQLAGNPSGQLTFPATATIPVGAASTTFSISAVNDALVDGAVSVTLSANASNFVEGTTVVKASDNDVAALRLTLASSIVNENGGAVATRATVYRNTATTAALTVNLSSGPAGLVTLPASVTIAAGEKSATFDVGVVDDAIIDGDQGTVITAASPGFKAGHAGLTILDNELEAFFGNGAQTAAAPLQEPDGFAALLSAWASVPSDYVQLTFTAPLRPAESRDRGRYLVAVNGQEVAVEAANWDPASQSVFLSLPAGTLHAGDRVIVCWKQLPDIKGHVLSGQSATLVAE